MCVCDSWGWLIITTKLTGVFNAHCHLLSPPFVTLSLVHVVVQSNRIEKLQGLDCLVNLEELYISHNGITRIEGLEHQVEQDYQPCVCVCVCGHTPSFLSLSVSVCSC